MESAYVVLADNLRGCELTDRYGQSCRRVNSGKQRRKTNTAVETHLMHTAAGNTTSKKRIVNLKLIDAIEGFLLRLQHLIETLSLRDGSRKLSRMKPFLHLRPLPCSPDETNENISRGY